MKENILIIDTKKSFIKSVLVEDFLSSIYSLLVKVIDSDGLEVNNLTLEDFSLYTKNIGDIPITNVLEVESGFYKLFFTLTEEHICEKNSLFYVKVKEQEIEKPKHITGIVYPSIDGDTPNDQHGEFKVILPFVDNEPEFPSQHRMDWIVNGEPTTGSNNKYRAEGVLNRTAFQLYHNIITIKNAIDEVNAKYFDVWVGFNDMQAQFREHAELVEQLRKDAEEATEKAKEFVENYKAYVEGRFDEVNSKIFEMDIVQKMHDNKLEAHELSIQELKDKEPHFLQLLSEAEDDRNQIKDSVKTLDKKVDDFKEEYTKNKEVTDRDIQSLKDTIDLGSESIIGKVDEIHERIDGVDKTIQDNKDKSDLKFEEVNKSTENLKNELFETNIHVSLLDNKSEDHELRISKNTKDIENINTDIKSINDHNSKQDELISKNHDEIKSELLSTNSMVESLNKKSEDHDNRITDNLNSIESINKKLEDVDSTILDQSNYVQENLDRLDSKDKAQDSEIEELKNTTLESDATIQLHGNKLEDHELRISKNTNDIENINADIKVIQDKNSEQDELINENYQDLNNKIDLSNKEIHENLNDHNLKIDNNTSSIKDINEKIEDIDTVLLDQSNYVQENLDRLDSKDEEQDLNIKSVKDSLFESNIIIQMHDNKLEDHELRITDNKGRIDSLSSDLDEYKDKTDKEILEINEALDLGHGSINDKIEEFKEELNKTNAEVKQNKEEIDKTKSDLFESNISIQMHDNKLEDHELRISKNSNDISAINIKDQSQDELISQLNDGLNESNNKIASLEESSESLAKNIQEINEKDNEQDSLISELDDSIKSNELRIESNTKSIEVLNSDVSDVSKLAQENKESIIESNKIIESHGNKLDDHGNEINDIKEQIKGSESNINSSIEDINKQLDDHDEDINSLSKSITELSEKHDSDKKDLEDSLNEHNVHLLSHDDDIKSINEKLFDNDTIVKMLDDKSEDHELRISKNTNDLKGVNTKVSEQEVLVNKNREDIDLLLSKSEDTHENIISIEKSISENRESIISLEDGVTEVNKVLDEHGALIKDNKEEIELKADKEYVDSINAEINSNLSKIDYELSSKVSIEDYTSDMQNVALKQDLSDLEGVVNSKRGLDNNTFDSSITITQSTRDQNTASIEYKDNKLSFNLDKSSFVLPEVNGDQILATEDYVSHHIGNIDLSVFATKDELELKADTVYVDSGLEDKATYLYVDDKFSSIDLTPYAKAEEINKSLDLKADKTDLEGLATEEYVDLGLEQKADKDQFDILSDVVDTKVDSEYVKSEINKIDYSDFVTQTELTESLEPKLEKSDLDGLASETFVEEQIKAIPEVDLTPYATLSYTDEKLSQKVNLSDLEPLATKEELTLKADKKDLEGLATETFVKEQIEAVDHSIFVERDEYEIGLSGKVDNDKFNELTEDVSTKANKTDLEGLASESYVDSKIDEIDLTPFATKDSLNDYLLKEDSKGFALKSELELLDNTLQTKANKTDLEGLASESYVDDKFDSIEIPEVDLTPYAKTEDINKSLELKADKADLDGLATESYVDSKIDEIDLDPYATKESLDDYLLKDDSKEFAKVTDIDSLELVVQTKADKSELDGLASEEFVKSEIDKIEIPEVDLTPYAKTEDVNKSLGLKADKTDLDTKVDKDLFESELSKKLEQEDIKDLATESFVKEQIEAVDHSIFVERDEYNELSEVVAKKADKDSLIGLASESYVDSKIEDIDLTPFATKDDLSLKADNSSLDNVISQLETKADKEALEGLATESFVKEQIEAVDHSNFVDKEELENKLSTKADKSELSDLASTEYVDTKIVEIDLTPYAKTTEIDDKLDLKADKTDLNTKVDKDLFEFELSKKLEQEDIKGLASEEYVKEQIDLVDHSNFVEKQEFEDKLSDKLDKNLIDDYAKKEELKPLVTKEELSLKADITYVDSEISKITFDGLATEEYVDSKVESIEIPEVDLTPYAKTEDVNKSLDLKADISEIELLATKEEIKDLASTEYVDTKIVEIDLTPYAKTEDLNLKADITYVDSEISKITFDGLATEEYVDEQINKIEIPEVDLDGLATEEYVDSKVNEIDLTPYAKTEDINKSLDLKANKTDLDGLATEEYVDSKVESIEIPEVDLTPYAKTEDVNKSLDLKADISYVDSEIDKIEIPSIEGLASESYVDSKIEDIDLTPFAKTEDVNKSLELKADISYVDSEISKIEIPEVDLTSYATKEDLTLKADKEELDGLATEEFVKSEIDKIEIPEVDLTPYAKTEDVNKSLDLKADSSYVDSEISKIEVPSIEGLATEEFVTEQIKSIPEVDLTPYATKESLNDYLTVEQSNDFAKTDYVDQEISKIPLGDYVKEVDLNQALESKADAESLTGLATEEYVKSEIDKIEFDLTPYATKEELSTKADISYVDEKVSNIEIPSIEGLATEEYVQSEIDKIDLNVYATKEELSTKVDQTDLKDLATESYVDERLSSIEIPEVDLTDYAKSTDVENKLNLKADKTDLEIYATKEELVSKADISYVEQEVNKIEIPSIEGLASEEYVDSKVKGIDLTDYAKTEDVNKSLEAKADKESLIGLATEEYVQSEIDKIEVPEVDLSDYATKEELLSKVDKTYVDAEISKIDIPSIEGLAKESYVDEKFDSIDLTPYATKEELSTKADTTYVDDEISKIEIPSIEGLATEEYVRSEIDKIEVHGVDLTDYAKTEDVKDQLNLKADKADLEDYLTIDASKEFATKEDLESIDVSSLASKEYVDEKFDGVITVEVLHDFTTPRLHKVDRYNPVFFKEGSDLYIKKGTKIIFGDSVLNINEDAKIDITETLKGGEDYVVYVDREGKFTVLADPFEAPHTPLENQFLLGGFHNSDIKELENDWDSLFKSSVIGINAYSLWDINFRANGLINSIGSVRFGQLSNHGMVYDARTNRWVALYFTSTDVDKYGLSKYNSNIASGTVLPTKPKLFGNGEYDNLNWWTANEIVSTHGARLLYENEFNSRALGVNENFGIESGLSETAKKTEHIASLTSYLGCEQTVGVQWYWGMDSSFRYDGSMPSHKDVTEGQGSVYTQGDYGIVRALFGGSPTDEKSHIGSKHTMWMAYPWFSSWDVSIIASKEHLIL